MIRWTEKKPALMFFAGLAVGLLLVLGLLAGLLVGGFHDWSSQERASLETPIFAVASHGGESFALASGPIDDEMEGIFTLDFLTGDLKCRVLNSRSGKFAASFDHNVMADLEVKRGKKPDFVIMTGVANFLRGGGSSRPSRSVLYVADCNSGNVVAYSLSWNRNMASTMRPQKGPFVLLDKFKGRTVVLRD